MPKTPFKGLSGRENASENWPKKDSSRAWYNMSRAIAWVTWCVTYVKNTEANTCPTSSISCACCTSDFSNFDTLLVLFFQIFSKSLFLYNLSILVHYWAIIHQIKWYVARFSLFLWLNICNDRVSSQPQTYSIACPQVTCLQLKITNRNTRIQ